MTWAFDYERRLSALESKVDILATELNKMVPDQLEHRVEELEKQIRFLAGLEL